jgi:hypothetical protein
MYSMSIPRIVGIPADPAGDNPVAVRGFQIEGSALQAAIGFPETPVYTNRPDFPSERRYWQYYSNGMILCDANTCAQVLFGPILDYYASVNQFESALGFPSTDVSQMPDGTSFVAFENGVIWLDEQGTIHNLDPIAPILVKAFSGIDPSPSGIAAFAQNEITTLAQQQLQTNPQLSGNVSSISATVQFESTGDRGCAGASLDTLGHSLLRSHIFKVHFDFGLSGCAGAFGSASADMHMTVRLRVSPAKISAFLESFNIDAVSSPGGLGDNDIQTGLSNAFYSEQGVDLINQPVQAGANVLSAIVDDAGNVNVYTEPLCMGSSMMRRVANPRAESTLEQIRQLRDKHLVRSPQGRQIVQLFEAAGPVVTEAVRREEYSSELRGRVSEFLVHNFKEGTDLASISKALEEPGRHAIALIERLANNRRQDAIQTVLNNVIRFMREEISPMADIKDVSKSLTRMLQDEYHRIDQA